MKVLECEVLSDLNCICALAHSLGRRCANEKVALSWWVLHRSRRRCSPERKVIQWTAQAVFVCKCVCFLCTCTCTYTVAQRGANRNATLCAYAHIHTHASYLHTFSRRFHIAVLLGHQGLCVGAVVAFCGGAAEHAPHSPVRLCCCCWLASVFEAVRLANQPHLHLIGCTLCACARASRRLFSCLHACLHVVNPFLGFINKHLHIHTYTYSRHA